MVEFDDDYFRREEARISQISDPGKYLSDMEKLSRLKLNITIERLRKNHPTLPKEVRVVGQYEGLPSGDELDKSASKPLRGRGNYTADLTEPKD